PLINVVPTWRLMFATNEVPRFGDKSDGIWRRLLILPFNHVIPEDDRTPGMDKAGFWEESGELPGVLNWALEELRELIKETKWRFPTPKACRDALNQHRFDSNPARAFLNDHVGRHDDLDRTITKPEMYHEYKQWCMTNGRKAAADNTFAGEVKRYFNLKPENE